jgi:Flp pilus assembly secretin CpaC
MPPFVFISKKNLSRLLFFTIGLWLMVAAGASAANPPLSPMPALGAKLIISDDVVLQTSNLNNSLPLTIHVGASIIIELAGIERVQVAEPNIADVVVVEQGEVVINGLSCGQTTMHVWLADKRLTYTLLVVDPSSEPLEQLLTKAIALPGVHVAQFRNTILLEGVVPNELMRQRALAIARAYTNDVVDLLIVEDAENQVPTPIIDDIPSESGAQIQALQQSLGEATLRIYILGESLIIEGSVPTLERKERAEKLTAVLFPQYVSLIRVESEYDTESVAHLQELIAIPTVRVRLAKEQIILTGSVASQAEHDRVCKLAALQELPVIDLLEITPAKPRQIVLNVQVIESDSIDTTTSGVTWGTSNNSGFTPWTYVISQTAAGANPLVAGMPISAQITSKTSSGSSKLLAAPLLRTLSGQEASFLAGGEIPVLISSGGDNQIYWKEYGVKLRVLPILHEDGDISVTVIPEVSTLDWANGVRINNFLLPALKTRRAETNLRLKPGQTVVLGGLLLPSESKQLEKLPVLGDLPIIGNLFRSQSFQKGCTELLIFVTPNVVDDDDAANELSATEPNQN